MQFFVIIVFSLFLCACMVFVFCRLKGHNLIFNGKTSLQNRISNLEGSLVLQRHKHEKDLECFSKALHDDMGNSLASLKLMANALTRNMQGTDLEMAEAMKVQLNYCIASLRNILHDSYPSSLRKYGLGMALGELCRRWNNPMLANIGFLEKRNPYRFQEDHELIIYRAAQELVGNAIKHAQATQVNVCVMWENDELVITVEDNGIGYNARLENPDSTGLRSIEGSLKAINGKLAMHKLEAGLKAELKVLKSLSYEVQSYEILQRVS